MVYTLFQRGMYYPYETRGALELRVAIWWQMHYAIDNAWNEFCACVSSQRLLSCSTPINATLMVVMLCGSPSQQQKLPC